MQIKQQKQFFWGETLYFTKILLRVNLRNRQMLMISLLTPLLLFAVFYLSEGQEGLLFMLPIIVSFPIFFSGSTLASQLVSWRELAIFKRLAVTPTPLAYLMGSIVLVQICINLLQVLILLGLFQVVLGGEIIFNLEHAGLLLLVTLAGNFCFLMYGAVIATITKQVESVNIMYMLTVLPTMFLGGGIISIPVFEQVANYLPTTLVTDSWTAFVDGSVDGNSIWLAIVALLIYATLLGGIAITRFQWE